jgi:hypothetical protein
LAGLRAAVGAATGPPRTSLGRPPPPLPPQPDSAPSWCRGRTTCRRGAAAGLGLAGASVEEEDVMFFLTFLENVDHLFYKMLKQLF